MAEENENGESRPVQFMFKAEWQNGKHKGHRIMRHDLNPMIYIYNSIKHWGIGQQCGDATIKNATLIPGSTEMII